MPRPSSPPRWGGAIAGWELTRLARRGTPTVARLLVGLLLFTALLITYLAAFPEDLERHSPGRIQALLAEFGQDFSVALLLVQAAVVLILTPLFVAGSIVEETERRTLEFLLATDLRPREIILGKLWPRLLLVFGVVLVGWPVLAATQFWGGVDVLFVALGSLVIVAEIWAVSGISAACAVGAPSLRKALTRSYFWSAVALILPVCTCPFGVIVAMANAQQAYARVQLGTAATPNPASSGSSNEAVLIAMLLAFAFHLIVMCVIGQAGIVRACRKLRHLSYFAARQHAAPKHRPQKWEQHPPVPDGSPLLWKELNLSGQTTRFVRSLALVPWVVWLCVSSVATIVCWAMVIGQQEDVLKSMNDLIRWGGGALVALMALMVGLNAAGSVARERQQETLTDLLTVPRPRREILWAKWIGSLSKARGIAIGTGAIPLVGVLAEGLSYWAVVPLLVAAFAYIACAASFGLWLSVRAPTVQRASGLWLLIVGIWVGGTFLGAEVAYEMERSARRMFTAKLEKPEPPVWDRALNPALAWSELAFRLSENDHSGYDYRTGEWRDGTVVSILDVWPSLLGIGLYAFLAWAFFMAAGRRFEREGRV
ncbi:MAG TPA: ABC transporter permease subunit [Gemmataceae bacterium]|nr:ABC transporter permease subunit [Gemmataceae bacterium]